MADYDFSGWATRVNRKCSDGLTIMRDAFKINDGATVPLVWNHQHNDPSKVLGHALLKNMEEGVYMYGTFNDTKRAKIAKALIEHGDIDSLSIWANDLKKDMSCVTHGNIREVSLVLAGANPGAYIDFIIAHGVESEEEAFIYEGYDADLEIHEEEPAEIAHSAEEPAAEPKKEEPKVAEKTEKTIQEIIDTMNDDQKNALYNVVGMALENNKGGADMKHNVFENEDQDTVLSHDAMNAIITDAKRYGSMKDSFLAHAEEYGIQNLEVLFPEPTNLNNPPEFIKRTPDAWVDVVMNGVHHSPFSRIKSMFADITEDEARAKGYIKGKLKKEEVFSLLKRSTTPTTIYKKQKMDRDDVIDITDFDVIAWLKKEMRMMLNEEIARAILVGDGRLSSSDDKISEDHIRPIVNDADLFVIRWGVASGATEDVLAKNFIKSAIKARKNYKGSGSPILFTTEDMLTEMLLLEDGIGHSLYKTEAELATKLRVSRIVPVSVMENQVDKDGRAVYGIIVNLSDYNVGADKGGAVSMFEDFDIDYNQQKYLIETRCSGALVKPFSAIVLRAPDTGAATGSEEPTLSAAMAPYKV